ncbi:MAG: hypothetical protein PUA70_02680 [Oribacterium sp.]|nr:hypothetical protein [Oribacterium sp.]
MVKLKKEFDDFYKEIRIDKESQDLKDKREVLQSDIKSKLPGIFLDHDINVNKSDIRMIDQGSYKYNTTIKDDVVDRDVAVILPLSTSDNSDPRKIKGYLRDSINIASRTVTIKEPCVRAEYVEDGKEWLHIDLPLYAQDGSSVYLARGKEYSDDYSWEDADPDGLNDYLCGKINGNDQLRRIICFVKKWRNEKYANCSSDHEVPPSIGLTLLACDCFSAQSTDEGDDDLLSLQMTMKSMLDKFYGMYDADGNYVHTVTRALPVTPYTDVYKKMKDSSSSYMTIFYNRLSTAVDNLLNAVNVESEHDAGEYVQAVLGNEFVVPPKEAVAAAAQNRREHSFG